MLTRALHFSTLPTGGVRMRHLGEKDRLIEVETKMNRF
ncbi:AAEL017256-PA [Aedes aegypti]|uniref:AAEL017256-PA n=1 Tax=Aedes aegypti TaxID=7159 RepID=J9HZC8_AEDAE|nr:AAEL017256-PA [Aedes aegypti]